MATDLVINTTSYEARVAVVENGNTVELYIERQSEKRLVGNIYRGRVVRVLPGMQAAFVDVGLDRTAFLYVDDIHVDMAEIERMLLKHDFEGCCDQMGLEVLQRRVPAGVNIEDLLHEGQDILVQICKEPLGTKGARLTCHISLPCRNLVLMPMTNHIGISKKIENEEVRSRLRAAVESLRPPGMGFIVRTVAENVSLSTLESDMEFLLGLWQEIQKKSLHAPVPSLVYEDLDITLRSVRDLFSSEVDRLVVDDRQVYERIMAFVDSFAPRLKAKIHKYDGEVPVFDAYGVEMDIFRALGRKIWLKSGGYIVLEMTEALTVIDVNTGRYVGKNDLEQTILKTNMEAVKEIAYQLRLRNIGGIIIIDFIDMECEGHRDEVFRALKEEVKKDRSRINLLELSEFGLVQMTRKRTCDSLSRMLREPCFYCDGEGLLKSRRTVCYEIFRKISREARDMAGSMVTIQAHPRVADILLKEEAANLEELEHRIGKRITIVPTKEYHLEKYEILWS